MSSNITQVSAQYREVASACREIFAAAGRKFVEPQGVGELIKDARRLYTELADEASAVKEVAHARDWLIGVAVKFLRGGVEHFEGRVKELSFMGLDRDIMDNMEARLNDYRAAVSEEDGTCFTRRITAYSNLAAAILGAREEQFRRNEVREQEAHEEVARLERERVARRRQEEAARLLRVQQEQEAAAAAARASREQQFDQLFG